ncbi:MAG: transglycosylase SLT domain-containing protein [Nitrospirota bacterium]
MSTGKFFIGILIAITIILSSNPPLSYAWENYPPKSISSEGTKVSSPEQTQSIDSPQSIESAELPKRFTIEEDEVIKRELKRIMAEFRENVDEVPPVFFDEIKRFVQIYKTEPTTRKFFLNSLQRSKKYMDAVKEILGERRIPEDMAYIAFVESGFRINARSPVGAVGLWQLMPKTARQYNLRVDSRIDERKDPIKATYAARSYFLDLIAIFGSKSFLLAMAAYNSGEGKIQSCLRQLENPFDDRDLWHIRDCLKPETREFPPRIIAAAIIGNNPEVFGFFPAKEPQIEDEGELTHSPLLAKKSIEEKKIGVGTKKDETLEVEAKEIEQYHAKIRSKPIIYKVVKGNNLSLIADIFDVEIRNIMKWNGLKKAKIVAGQRLKIYPEKRLAMIKYRVKKGDTAEGISRYYGIKPKVIMVTNAIRNKNTPLPKGRMLTLYVEVKSKKSA